ncbi:MAG: DoxX family protein [Thermoanaerobaculia bacterium]
MRGITIVRVAAAATMIIHGTFRVFDGGVSGFGQFLGSQGLPAGVAVAWLLTIVEIAGGLLLVAGRFVRPLCAWFILELLAGVVMVHFREGWFVVGGGRNGFEYSTFLIVCFAAVALDAAAARPDPAGAAAQTT